MAQEIERLKKRLNELEGPVGKPRQEFGKGRWNKSDIKCFRCGRPVHIARECRGGRKRNDDPGAEQDGRGKRQAKEGQGKAGRG